MQIVLIALVLCYSVLLHAEEATPVAEEVPITSSTVIFGVPLGSTIQEVMQRFDQMHLHVLSEKKQDPEGNIREIMIDGIPPEMASKNHLGKTRLMFFKDRLIKVTFLVDPLYDNFVLLRNQLFASFGSRYALSHKIEKIDDSVKEHVSLMKPVRSKPDSTQQIVSSVSAGMSYFFYTIKDNTDELSIAFSYSSMQAPEGDRKVALRLEYALKRGIQSLQQYNRAVESIYAPAEDGAKPLDPVEQLPEEKIDQKNM